MTREEEIWNAINNLQIGDYNEDDSSDNDEYCGNDLQNAFYTGAKWADEHPKSPWISVEDDLPCNHPELIDCGITEEIIMTDGKFATSGIMSNLDNNGWKFTMSDTKYWMPIPKPPKE